MKKHLIVIGIVVLLLAVGLSGCTDTGVNDGTKSSDIIEKTYFTLSGNITNNYAENIEIDCAIVTDELDGWEYWAPTIEFSSLESKDFGCEVKSGYLIYWFWIQIFYPDGSAGYFLNDFNFSNPLGEDMTYYIEVKNNGEIEIFTDYSHVSKNKSPSVSASAGVTSGNVPLTVLFTGFGNDSGGNIIEHHWDFGDGDTSNEQNPTHIFQEYGTYIVRFTVTDNEGATGTDTISITVKFPEPEIIAHGSAPGVWGLDIFGKIKNVGNTNIKNMYLTVTLYDASNNIIATNNNIKPAKPIVEPLQTSVFLAGFSEDYFDHYEVEIKSYQVTDESPYDGVSIKNEETSYPSESCERVTAIVHNVGSKVIDHVCAYGSFYDSNGNLLHIGKWGFSPWHVYSGEERTFAIQVCEDELDVSLSKIASYELEIYYEI